MSGEDVGRECDRVSVVRGVAVDDFASRLYDEERGGKTFTASDADTLGTEAQRKAEAIAGQVSQAAGKLNLTLED